MKIENYEDLDDQRKELVGIVIQFEKAQNDREAQFQDIPSEETKWTLTARTYMSCTAWLITRHFERHLPSQWIIRDEESNYYKIKRTGHKIYSDVPYTFIPKSSKVQSKTK